MATCWNCRHWYYWI